MVNGQPSNLQKLILSLLEPIKQDPEYLITKNLKPEQYKMFYTAKGLLPMVSKMLRIDIDPAKLIIGMVDKLENISTEKWTSLEELLMKVIQGDEQAMEQIKKVIQS